MLKFKNFIGIYISYEKPDRKSKFHITFTNKPLLSNSQIIFNSKYNESYIHFDDIGWCKLNKLKLCKIQNGTIDINVLSDLRIAITELIELIDIMSDFILNEYDETISLDEMQNVFISYIKQSENLNANINDIIPTIPVIFKLASKEAKAKLKVKYLNKGEQKET